MRQVDSLFEAFSQATAVPPDHLKLITILLLLIPLSVPLARLPASSKLIHVYSLALNWFFLTQVLYLSPGMKQCLGQSIGTWLIVKYFRKSNKSKAWYWAIFLGNMGVLTINHFVRYIETIPLDIVEISGAQMVLVMKLSLFAWASYDGGRPSEELDPVQKRDRLEEVPDLLSFLGYCFFLPSFLTGPSFTYAAYAAFTDRSLFTSTKGKEKVIKLPRGRWRKAGKRIVIATFYLAIYATYAGKFSYEKLIGPNATSKPYWYNLLFAQIAGFIARTKYFTFWTYAEAGMIVSGLGWDPESSKWIRGRNLWIRQIEFAESYKTLLDAWNCGANYWLRECVYKRLAKKGKKPGFKSTMATFTTSAFWHGFNPTYYITFILGGFLQGLGRKMRANIRPFFLPPNYSALSKDQQKVAEKTITKRIYDMLCIIGVHMSLNFIVIPFVLLDLRPTFAAWKTLKFYGLYMTFLPWLFFELGGGRILKKQLYQRAKKAGVDIDAVERQRQEAKKAQKGSVNVMPDIHQAVKGK